ncbi:hypothetical protein MYSEV_278 [Mythimna separata entomopoxvirus 'L']|uniref:Uncharacterized protein n=1 Tax=Mythimna separata entomopoxvirus 'L' TaxID=1293572 RepID=A0A916KQG2_9POXV|nr:hypothetical protein MYSEV_278 [Mythimna separata entomopoxvirus 'L']CCU56476.1 hypothetical protein MYSEV_278 [Mythimna separata entomopoxvirus 'L']
MIPLIVKTNDKSIICNSILLNILPYFKIINNNKYYNYVTANTKIINSDIHTYVNIFFTMDDKLNAICKKIDIKIKIK